MRASLSVIQVFLNLTIKEDVIVNSPMAITGAINPNTSAITPLRQTISLRLHNQDPSTGDIRQCFSAVDQDGCSPRWLQGKWDKQWQNQCQSKDDNTINHKNEFAASIPSKAMPCTNIPRNSSVFLQYLSTSFPVNS